MTDEEPTGDAWRTLNYLAGEVRRASDKVEIDRDANERRIQASVRKMRWYRRAGVAGAVLAVLALWAGWRANDAVDLIRAQRHESRIVTCKNDNTTAEKINRLNDRSQDLLRTAAAPNASRTPTQQAATDAFLKGQIAEYEAIKVPLRDCSPAAVERFYQSK